MLKELKPAILITFVLTILTGILYPLAVTGIAQTIFHKQANGSLIERDGKVIGSEIIGQNFTKPEYFHPRPSQNSYDAANSGGSNLGPTNPALADRLKKDGDAVPQGQSGLHRSDPGGRHHGVGERPRSRRSARRTRWPRRRAWRRLAAWQLDAVENLVAANTQQRDLGVLGEPRVNVLKLNLALDQTLPVKR